MKLNTIKRALKNLKESGYIDYQSGLNQKNKWDKTNYYRIVEKQEQPKIEMSMEINTEITRNDKTIEAGEVANYLEDKLKEQKPNYHALGKNKWIADIKKGMEEHNRSKVELIRAIQYAMQNEFWHKVIKMEKV